MMNTKLKPKSKILGYCGAVLACLALLAASPSLHATVFADHGRSTPQMPWETERSDIRPAAAPVIVIFIVVYVTAKSILAVEKKADTLAAEL